MERSRSFERRLTPLFVSDVFLCLTMAVTWTLVTLYADGDRKGWGEMYLYFGCRQNDVDNIYRDELSQMKKEKVLTDYFVALSREPGQPKVM